MNYLNFVNNNLYLYLAIIIALLILDVILTIICLNQRKRRNIKEQFSKIEDEEEKLESITDEVKPEVAFELEEILEKMQRDVEMQPEDVVRKFEEEQEQKAIISYQELVDSVNNNKIDVVDDEEGDMDYVAALEKQLNPKEENCKHNYNNSDYANKSHLDVIDQMEMEDEPKRFKNSEVLSPVFGRMQPEFEYKKINSFSNTNNKVEVEQVSGPSTADDVKNNEDFLKALIEFRNNL